MKLIIAKIQENRDLSNTSNYYMTKNCFQSNFNKKLELKVPKIQVLRKNLSVTN